MTIYDLLLAKKLGGGGGGEATLINKNINTNGTYNASSDNADGYSKVVVNVEEGAWERPSEWPDITKLDRTGEVLYLTYPATEDDGYVVVNCANSFNVAVGHIEGNNFVVDIADQPANSNSIARVYFGGSGGYKVVRITAQSGKTLSKVNFAASNSGKAVDGIPMHPNRQFTLEAYGNLPNCTDFVVRNLAHLECVDVSNIKPTSLNTSFQRCRELHKVVTDTWDTSSCTSFADCFNGCEYLNEINAKNLVKSACTTVSGMFNGCTDLKKLDLSGWNTSAVTIFSSLFAECRELEELTLPSSFVQSSATNLAFMFQNTNSIKSLDMSGWNTSNVTRIDSMFKWTTEFEVIDFRGLDLSKVTSTSANNGMYAMATASYALKIYFPASLTVVGNFITNSEQVPATIYEFHFLSTTPPTMGGTYLNALYDGTEKIYVPYSADHSVLNAYKTASNWSTYANYIFEEEQ